ncbi:MAG: hypothetical protein ACK5NB_06970 [Flavobacteriaceae bacterium]
MFFSFKQHISFLLQSTNQHGVHSPFVYGLVTKCFYDKTEYPEYKFLNTKNDSKLSIKQQKLLFRLTKYFNFKSVLVVNDKPGSVRDALLLTDENINIFSEAANLQLFDFIFINDTALFQIKTLETLLKNCHNDTVILFNDINQAQAAYAVWKTIRTNPNVTVTINTFRFGFVFVRCEQAKQHFVVRV